MARSLEVLGRAAVLALALGVPARPLAAGGGQPRPELDDLMAKGKLAVDLGDYDGAAQAFAAVAETADAPKVLRADALVRLGAVRQAAGDFEGALKVFDRAWKEYASRDAESLSLLVRAIDGALPSPERWAEIWTQVALLVDRSDPARPVLTVHWPGVPPRTRHAYVGRPISLDFKDGNLNDVFRLFADITGLNVVVFPGVRGTITMAVDKQPWDQVLERVLAPNGLVFRVDGNVLLIGPASRLGAPLKYAGRSIDLDLKGEDLREVLASLARTGQESVAVDPAVQGRVTLRLKAVPWDQAFDIVVRVNGLAWAREGGVLRVGPDR